MSRSRCKPTSLAAAFCVLQRTPLARHSSVGIRSGNCSPGAGARQHAHRRGWGSPKVAWRLPLPTAVWSAVPFCGKGGAPRRPSGRPSGMAAFVTTTPSRLRLWPPRYRHTADGHRQGARRADGSRGARGGSHPSKQSQRHERWSTGSAAAIFHLHCAACAGPVRRLLEPPPSSCPSLFHMEPCLSPPAHIAQERELEYACPSRLLGVFSPPPQPRSQPAAAAGRESQVTKCWPSSLWGWRRPRSVQPSRTRGVGQPPFPEDCASKRPSVPPPLPPQPQPPPPG